MLILFLCYSGIQPSIASENVDTFNDIKFTHNIFWWMKGYEFKEMDDKLSEIGGKIGMYIGQEEKTLFNDAYGSSYINSDNNTIFIVIKYDDINIKKYMIGTLQPDKSVNIIFRKCEYSYDELYSYKEKIVDLFPYLNSRGIPINTIGINENATLTIGFERVDQNIISHFFNELPSDIPKHILVFISYGIHIEIPRDIRTQVNENGTDSDSAQVGTIFPGEKSLYPEAIIFLVSVIIPGLFAVLLCRKCYSVTLAGASFTPLYRINEINE